MQSSDKEAAEALTGRILQTDGTDFVQAPKQASWLRQRWVEVATVAVLLALLGTVVGLAVGLSRSRGDNRGIDPACIHALGGGPVKSGGGLDSAAPGYCREQLRAYADSSRGSYRREVDLAMLAAMTTFGFAGHKAAPQQQQQQGPAQQGGLSPSHPAALAMPGSPEAAPAGRFSRSLLSSSSQGQSEGSHAVQQGAGVMVLGGPVAAAGLAAGSWLQPPAPGRDKVVVFDIDETVLSNMPQILDPVSWPWDKWVAAAQAQAIQPTLRFYRALCDAGYSVAFITGRKEASRNSTRHNLEAEGYGKPCVEGPGPFYGVGPAARAAGGVGSARECCYSALYLRQAGDTSLASVYKPGARKDLMRRGNMTVLALVGDQFSDLNGEQSAPYAFKLPNPFYYIL